MSALLTAQNISFAYDDRPVLKGVSLAVEAGEFVGLIGANGSGKTTLLRILLGLTHSPCAVRLCGELLKSLDRRDIARRATMAPQDTHIDFAFTAREIVAMGRTPYLGRFTPERSIDQEAIARAMRETGVEGLAERPVTELSGGERQRVHLAHALAQETRVILLDEPTANLDLAHQYEALELIWEFTRAGGARSGKSRYAQSLCDSSSSVIYIATARTGDGAEDPEMRERIARHRADRPAEWHTVEEPLDLSRAVLEAPVEASLLIDCATLWISNLMWEFREDPVAEQQRLILIKVVELIEAVRLRAEKSMATRAAGEVVIVSNEVGGGLVPEHAVARAFRDLQGFANQRLAQAADNVVFIIAGLPLRLKPGAAVN